MKIGIIILLSSFYCAKTDENPDLCKETFMKSNNTWSEVCGEAGASCEIDEFTKAAKCACKDNKKFNPSETICKELLSDSCEVKVCGKYETCRPTDGKCHCKNGYQKKDNRPICIPEKFCKTFTNVKCEEGPPENPQNVRYYCDTGYILKEENEKKYCKNIACDLPNRCNHKCIPFDDSYTCDCYPNFTLDDDQYTCSRNSGKCQITCGNKEICIENNNQQECVCRNNYIRVNGKCEDICTADELVKGICPEKCIIHSTLGFICECKGKYRLSADNRTCETYNQCAKGEQGFIKCSNRSAVCQEDDKNGFKCVCPKGFILEKDNCIELCTYFNKNDECKKQFAECSIEDYESDKIVCRCPPSMKMVNDSCQFAESSFVGKINLPNRYKLEGPRLNIPRLQKDFENAMINVYGSKLESVIILDCDGDEQLDCKFELQFIRNIENKIAEAMSQNRYCNILSQNEFCIFPPNLLVSKQSQISVLLSKTNQCQPDIVSQFCPNSTDCIKDNIGYNCTCKHGYRRVSSESISESNIKEVCEAWCDPNPCKHGSCSVDEENKYFCRCEENYYGVNCTNHISSERIKISVIIGSVMGSLLFVALIIIIILLIRLKNIKNIRQFSNESTSEDFRSSNINRGSSSKNMLSQDMIQVEDNLNSLKPLPRIHQSNSYVVGRYPERNVS